jgi:hypothetical protein
MLRAALFSAALFAAALSPSAHSSDYVEGRVISVVPHLSLSFGSLLNDGFRVDYEFGGQRYSTHSHRHPGRVILVPPPYRIIPVGPRFGHRHNHWRNDDRHDWDDDDHGDDRRHWRKHDRRGWDDHDRGDDHRHWRGDDRGRGRKHGRH